MHIAVQKRKERAVDLNDLLSSIAFIGDVPVVLTGNVTQVIGSSGLALPSSVQPLLQVSTVATTVVLPPS